MIHSLGDRNHTNNTDQQNPARDNQPITRGGTAAKSALLLANSLNDGVEPGSVHGVTEEKFRQLVALNLFPDPVDECKPIGGQLIESASKLLSQSGFGEYADIKNRLSAVLSAFGEERIKEFHSRANAPVDGWGYRDRDPVSRAIFREVIPLMLAPGSTITGTENVLKVANSPIVFLGNHLAALDVHLLDHALVSSGLTSTADRLTAVVGHKTFLFPFLRQMSLTFGTLQVPQSMSVSPRSSEMGARALARGASQVIATANERLREGESLVVFPEGTRSRNGVLYPMLPGVARYLRDSGAFIVPWAHWGIEQALPPDTFTVSPKQLHVRFGKPVKFEDISVAGARKPEEIMDVIGFLIARLLPEDRRGAYGDYAVSGKLQSAERAANLC